MQKLLRVVAAVKIGPQYDVIASANNKDAPLVRAPMQIANLRK
jgi:hypothetical protein